MKISRRPFSKVSIFIVAVLAAVIVGALGAGYALYTRNTDAECTRVQVERSFPDTVEGWTRNYAEEVVVARITSSRNDGEESGVHYSNVASQPRKFLKGPQRDTVEFRRAGTEQCPQPGYEPLQSGATYLLFLSVDSGDGRLYLGRADLISESAAAAIASRPMNEWPDVVREAAQAATKPPIPSTP